MANMRGLMGSIIYWAAVLLVLFGIISAAMSLALFEGDERLWGTVRWVAFTIAAFVVGRIARIALSR